MPDQIFLRFVDMLFCVYTACDLILLLEFDWYLNGISVNMVCVYL